MATPSAESSYGRPRELRLGHKIFLSHSGEDKVLVRFLADYLRQRHYDPFFDEDCLPKGAVVTMQNILGELQQCKLALFLLSDDFFTKTRNPMKELAAGVEHEVELLPLFYGLTVKQCKDESIRASWRTKWSEWQREGHSGIDIDKWDKALQKLIDVNGIEYETVAGNSKEYVEIVVQKVCGILPPDFPLSDKHMQGKDRLCQEVDCMFAACPIFDSGPKVLALHGMVGMGKTALCEALHDFYYAEFRCKVCYLRLDSRPSTQDEIDQLKQMEKVILCLTRATTTFVQQHITDVGKAKQYLDDCLSKSDKVFLVIDNIRHSLQSQEQVRELFLRRSSFPSGSKVLLMARSRKTLLSLLRPLNRDCKICSFPHLNFDEAKNIFLKESLFLGQGESTIEKLQRDNTFSRIQDLIKQSVNLCTLRRGKDDYNPLMLKSLGLHLGPNTKNWRKLLKNLGRDCSKGMEEVSKHFQNSFRSLEKKEQDLFLDMALYTPWKDPKKLRPQFNKADRDKYLQTLIDFSFLTDEHEILDVHKQLAKEIASRWDTTLVYVEDNRSLQPPDLIDILHENERGLERVAFVRCIFPIEKPDLDFSSCVSMKALLLDDNEGLKSVKLARDTLDSVVIQSPNFLVVEGSNPKPYVRGLAMTMTMDILDQVPSYVPWTFLGFTSLVILEIGGASPPYGKVDSACLKQCKFLKFLQLYNIQLTSSVLELSDWPNLRELRLSRLGNLTTLSGMQFLRNLEVFTLTACEELSELQLPAGKSLKHYSIKKCDSLWKVDVLVVQDPVIEGCESDDSSSSSLLDSEVGESSTSIGDEADSVEEVQRSGFVQELVKLLQHVSGLRMLTVQCADSGLCGCDTHPPNFGLVPNVEKLKYHCSCVSDLSSVGFCSRLTSLHLNGCSNVVTWPDFSQLSPPCVVHARGRACTIGIMAAEFDGSNISEKARFVQFNSSILQEPLREDRNRQVDGEKGTDQGREKEEPYLCSLSAWEREHCPWWIDMESGYLLVSEREIHRQQNENTQKQEKIVGDKRKRVEKPVEDEIETVELDAPHTDLDAQAIVARRSMRFVHLFQHISSNSQRVSRSSHCLALVGDYVAIGCDFASSIKNKTYGMLREHVLQHRPQGREYVRIGRHVSWAADWAADMVFLDLPFGGVLDGMHSSPAWDSLTEDHVRYGVAVAAASLSDSGWLLVMASLAGHAMRWLEQYCRFSDLEIWHRVSILHHTPYGYLDLLGHRVECDMSSLLLIRRRGTEPSLRYVESLPFFTTMGMQPLDTRVCHYLPPRHRHTREDGMEWRGPLQRSHSFLRCYMELLCPHDGIVFEMGCGTGPMMRASLETDRLCVSIDSDERIVAEAVQPLLLARKSLHGEESSSSVMGADEVDIAAGHNPFDYILPVYAEATAKRMARDPRYHICMNQRATRKNIFIDDECEDD